MAVLPPTVREAMSATVVDADRLDLAVAELLAGGLVAIPTETVYGLGADAASATAVGKIFAAKGRPADHPLIVHVHNAMVAASVADGLDERFHSLAEAFWPGPLTIVVERRVGGPTPTGLVASETVGGRPTVGLRVPDHPLTLELLERFAAVGSGLVAAPSANRFGSISPTTAAHVVDDDLSGVGVVIDGGASRVGVESTIIDLTGSTPEILRPGGISRVELESVIGRVVDGRSGESRAPGMLASHYAPETPVRLVQAGNADRVLSAIRAETKTGVIAPFAVDHEPHWQLPPDATGYAARLYSTLRSADMAGVEELLVVPPVSGRLRDAVLDRLTKAAA